MDLLKKVNPYFALMGILMLFVIGLMLWVAYPPHLLYSGGKSYEQINKEFWQKDATIFSISVTCRRITQEMVAMQTLAEFYSEDGKERKRAYCLKEAKKYWSEAKWRGGRSDVPGYLVNAVSYLRMGNIDPEEIGLSAKAMGKELFDYYVGSFKTMRDSFRGYYTVSPPVIFSEMERFLVAIDMNYDQLGVETDEWIKIKTRY